MTRDQDVLEFAQKVGAKEPENATEMYTLFRSIFRRSNYFFLKDKVLITKISRSNKPFWGVGKKYLDLLDGRFRYFLVLFVSSHEGWVFSDAEVKRNIAEDKWRLAEKDQNYKINTPLPDRNSFSSPELFLRKVERYGT